MMEGKHKLNLVKKVLDILQEVENLQKEHNLNNKDVALLKQAKLCEMLKESKELEKDFQMVAEIFISDAIKIINDVKRLRTILFPESSMIDDFTWTVNDGQYTNTIEVCPVHNMSYWDPLIKAAKKKLTPEDNNYPNYIKIIGSYEDTKGNVIKTIYDENKNQCGWKTILHNGIVETYENIDDARIGHSKWVGLMQAGRLIGTLEELKEEYENIKFTKEEKKKCRENRGVFGNPDYWQRVIGRYSEEGKLISTVLSGLEEDLPLWEVEDFEADSYYYETFLKLRPNWPRKYEDKYNDVVELYGTFKEAEEGHKKWVQLMKEGKLTGTIEELKEKYGQKGK